MFQDANFQIRVRITTPLRRCNLDNSCQCRSYYSPFCPHRDLERGPYPQTYRHALTGMVPPFISTCCHLVRRWRWWQCNSLTTHGPCTPGVISATKLLISNLRDSSPSSSHSIPSAMRNLTHLKVIRGFAVKIIVGKKH